MKRKKEGGEVRGKTEREKMREKENKEEKARRG